MSIYFTAHTIEASAEALRQVRATGTELDVNLFLCALERHYGTDHMRAAHRLAGEIAEARMAAERAADLAAEAEAQASAEPAEYKVFGREIGQYVGGMYRFYCYMPAWPISPAALGGYTLAEV